MKRLTFMLMIALAAAGCSKDFEIDTTPPAPPQGIRTISLDNAVQIAWLPSQDGDVAGYKVWVSNRYDGEYRLIDKTSSTTFVDYGAVNGVTSYYAVSSYDFSHNESALSRDVAYDTPRPEGYGVLLKDYRTVPNSAGYEFYSLKVVPYDDKYADVFFEDASGYFFLNVYTDTDIQDMGYTVSLDDISVAPQAGWTPSKSAEAIAGHTYVILTWDNHFAKLRVRQVSASGLVFDWAYQTASGNPELKRNFDRPNRIFPLTREAGTVRR